MRLSKFNIKSGFTLIEMLIAIFLLGLGVIGILAVFPVGIKDTSFIADNSTATILASSIKGAITAGMQQVSPQDKINLDKPATFILYHDGTGDEGYEFALPADYGIFYYYPCGPFPEGISQGSIKTTTFQLGTDSFLKDTLTNEKHGTRAVDPSDPYDMFSFIIGVRQVGKGFGDKDMVPHKIYEFKVFIFKGYEDDSEKLDVANLEENPFFIRSFSFRLTGK